MMLEMQMLGFIFSLFMIYFTFVKFKRREFTYKESFVWLGIWMITLLLSVLPTSLDVLIVSMFGFSRRLDFLIVIGFFSLIGISFYTYSIVRKTERRIEKLVRKIAIQGKKNKEK